MTPDDREELTRLADQHRAAVDAEYGQFVAAQDIFHEQVLAYAKGTKVPLSNVKRHGYLQQGLVTTPEAIEAERRAAAEVAAQAEADAEAEREKAFQDALQQHRIVLQLPDGEADEADDEHEHHPGYGDEPMVGVEVPADGTQAEISNDPKTSGK